MNATPRPFTRPLNVYEGVSPRLRSHVDARSASTIWGRIQAQLQRRSNTPFFIGSLWRMQTGKPRQR
jgi:hypothetical protein